MPNSTRRTGRDSVVYNDFSGGVQEFTSPIWVKENETPFSTNIDLRKPGVLSKDMGYELAGASGTAGAIKGLGVFEKEDGTYTLLKLQTTTLSSYTGSGWTSQASVFTNNSTDKAEFVNAFLDNTDRIYIATGHNDDLKFWDGSASGTVANVKAKHAELYNNRLYLGNVKLTSTVYPIRVQFSGLGVDTFDVLNDYFDDVGEPITALKAYAGKLYIFTENKLFSYDGYSLVEIPGDFGTTSARSVQIVEGRLLWYNRNGVFMYGGAGAPTLVSRAVDGWIKVISDPTIIAGGIDLYGRYMLYIGNVTYGGVAYTNKVLRYDVLINEWTQLPNRPFGCFATQKSGGSYITYAGDLTNNTVWKVGTSQGLNGSVLASEWQGPKFTAEVLQDLKNFYFVYLTFKPTGNSEYLTVKYRLDGESTWSQIGGTNSNVSLAGTDLMKTVALELPPNTSGKCIQLQITHSSATGGFTVYEVGLEYDIIKS